MDLTMQFCVLSCIIMSICHGFLLPNKTGISSVGTHGLTDSHYLILTDELGIQKQLIAQMETFVLQLQNELKTVNQEVKDLKSGNSATQSLAFDKLKNESFTQSRVVAELKNETSEFREKSARLQNSYDILQKKFDTLQNENNVFKGQITDLRNSSVMINQKLNFFTHSVGVSSIQNVTAIQKSVDSLTSKMNNLDSRLNSLSSISNSRSQDFLALLNKSNVADIKLETVDSRSQSFQNQTKNRIYSLEHNYTLVSNDIKTVKGKVQEMNEPVALTSCILNDVSYRDGQIIKFPLTKTSVGINNVAEFHSTGKFTCGKSGVYLFSVFIGYNGHYNADFVLYKNNQIITYVVIVRGTNSGDYYSGSGTVVVQMNAGDNLYIRAYRDMKVSASYSCFTVLKIN